MKKRLFPLIAGVCIGIIVGVGTAVPTLRLSEWLPHGSYNTAVKYLVHSVNHSVWIACIACCIIWAALAVRGRMNGWTRRAPELVAITSLLVAFNVDVLHQVTKFSSNIQSNLTALRSGLMIDIYRSGGPQIIVAIFVVAIGLFVLRRVHQKTVKGLTPRQTVPAMGSSPAVVRSLSAIDRCTHAIAQGNWGFYAIVLVVFTGMNLASFGFDIANSHSLRNSPNIILIQIDTLRADRLGCYGYQRKTSPNIDKLASESMRFEKAISPAPWTTASVAQYMTSKYLRTVRFEMPYSGIPANAVSIAGALKDHGYSTAGVNSNLLAGSKRGFARGFDTYDESVYDEISSPYVFSTAVKRLNALKNKKFFMFLLFMDVHSPYELHENHNFYPDYKGKLGKRVEVKFDDDANQYSKDDLKYLSALYDSEIAYTDEYIGKLMDELKKLNLYNDTLIILLSDHGEEFGEHGGMEHGKRLYDEALSVPLIIKLPGQHKGSVVGGTFPLMDLYPSIMDAVHLSTSSFNLDGIASHLQGLRKSDERDIYAATNFGFTDKSCIRTNSYKLIDDKLTSKQELFSLVLDPAETKNVLKSEPSLAGILTNRLKGKDQEIDKTIPSRSPSIAEPKADSADDSAKLRSLGYLH